MNIKMIQGDSDRMACLLSTGRQDQQPKSPPGSQEDPPGIEAAGVAAIVPTM